MSFRPAFFALSALLLAACASTPEPASSIATASCAPRYAWERVRAGDAPDAGCHEEAYRQATRLARELGELEAQRAQLETSLAGLAEDSASAGQTRRRIRQVDVDIEAIRGVAITRGLVDNDHDLDHAAGDD
ncbi:MAG: hypothetical protein R3F01_00875 [Lysobacteraceae bacterium]